VFLSKSALLNAQNAHSKCGAVTASYPDRVFFHSSADLHKQPFVSSEFPCLLPILEADFCLALGRKKYVRGLHTILNTV